MHWEKGDVKGVLVGVGEDYVEQYRRGCYDDSSANRNPSDKTRDKLAFLYQLYAKSLYAYGLSIYHAADIGIIEDAIHDVFIDIYTKQYLETVRNAKQYLVAAFRHRFLYLLKRSRRWSELDLEKSNRLAENDFPELWAENKEKAEADKIRYAEYLLLKLTPHQREAVHLRFIEGMSYDQISDIMQISAQSAKMLVHRSIVKLRTHG